MSAQASRVSELRKCDVLGTSLWLSSAGERLVANHKRSGLNWKRCCEVVETR